MSRFLVTPLGIRTFFSDNHYDFSNWALAPFKTIQNLTEMTKTNRSLKYYTVVKFKFRSIDFQQIKKSFSSLKKTPLS